MHRTTRLLALALTIALFAASCSGGSDDASPSDGGDVDQPSSSETSASSASSDDDAAESSDTDVDSDDAAASRDDAVAEAAGDDAEVSDEAADEEEDAAPLEDEDQLTSAGEGDADGEPSFEDAVYGGEITWGLTNDGTGFDTTGAIAPGSIRVINALADPIVGLTASGDWAPNMAESLVANDDFTVWTITMRPGITFHDGVAVDAAAVAANLQAFKDSSTTGVTFTSVEEIVVVDELVLEVRMNSPWATFPFQLVNQPGWLVSPETIGQNETFVGTGPFMLESWTPGDGVRVVRNPNYWREGFPFLDAINFKFLVDQTVKRQAFDAGDIAGYVSPGEEDIVDFLADDEVDVWIGTAGANEYLYVLNTAIPPFDDVRVRRAMAHAIDRQFIIDTFRAGLTLPANGPLSPSGRWWIETDYPEYDLDAAAALVAEYEAEVGPIEFTVKAEPNASVLEVIDVAISFWADAGMDAELVEIGQGSSAITAIIDDFQAISWFQFGQPDPDGLHAFMHSESGILNWSNLQSDKIDDGLDIGRQNGDFETRFEGYAMFQEALAEEVPFVWIDHLNGVEAAVTIPELNGIGQTGVLPDGEESLAMTSGSFFAWTGVWLEQ
ncbi:MAG: ABC transporter substrate-binding protein [Actinomycetota bacterium]